MRQALSWIITGAAAIAAPIALAQGLDPANLRELDDDDDTMTFEGRTVEQLDDMDVVRDGQKIGAIDEVLADAAGQIVAVVIDFEDDFLDDREVILAIDQLKFGDDGRVATVTLGDAELEGLPDWDDRAAAHPTARPVSDSSRLPRSHNPKLQEAAPA